VLAIQTVNSSDVRDYIDAIRGRVCGVCSEQCGDSCAARDEVRCSLDAYLIPVVEAIEEATGRTFDAALCLNAERANSSFELVN
jgi:hypothetical protein